ncbi:MAG TPA: metalloregulator ArsR/SmtB family transcription factor [Acidobacteriaceae bacterium]|jgi:DNA-binding transcriptional ArsR family regulator
MSTIPLGFSALAEPVRRQIVETLAAGELSVGDLVRLFPMSQPAISHHLRILRNADLVHVRASGQQRLYSLAPIGFSELGRWLEHMEKLSTERLSVLEHGLRSDQRSSAASTKKLSSKKKRKKS